MKLIAGLSVITLIICGFALWGGFTVHLAIDLAQAGWNILS